MKLHEKGAKAERDREYVVRKYDELCEFFRLKKMRPEVLATMTSSQIYKLNEDTYNRQPHARKLDYGEFLGLQPRRHPLRISWFWLDVLRGKQPQNKVERFILLIQIPFRYLGWRKRKIAGIEKAKKELEAAKAEFPDHTADEALILYREKMAALSRAIKDVGKEFKIVDETAGKAAEAVNDLEKEFDKSNAYPVNPPDPPKPENTVEFKKPQEEKA